MQHLLDIAFWMYASETIISAICLALFIGEWIRVGHASWAFRYVTFLIAGIGINSLVNVYARVHTFYGNYEILHCWWWPWRAAITLVFVTALMLHVSWRVFYRKGYIDSYIKGRAVKDAVDRERRR